jgi:UTP--glucose-1-phosphate uridylyltransferase
LDEKRYPALERFQAKMEAEGLDPMVIETFAQYYREVIDGATGLIDDQSIHPPGPDEVVTAESLAAYTAQGVNALGQAVRITLNGGLGTSMGLTGPKSLIPVKNHLTFLDVIMGQAERTGVRQVFMNSFSTHAATLQALAAMGSSKPPLLFLQNKFPKILRADFEPAADPANPELAWNPPGHGDVYTALHASGTLARLRLEGYRYALICNSDNLGANLDPALLGYFVEKRLPFMMEVARRTPADAKGGHLAVNAQGGLILRESAQFPPHSDGGDIRRYAYFNTNNLWINLQTLQALIERQRVFKLPLILNPKTLNPRDPQSPAVYQVESAMGAAIALFEGAQAVLVPRLRFLPVKKCNDLMVLRSDCYRLNDRFDLEAHPALKETGPRIVLDPRFYDHLDRFDARFPHGVPGLRECLALTVRGDVHFGANVRIQGRVTISNTNPEPRTIASGTLIAQDLNL